MKLAMILAQFFALTMVSPAAQPLPPEYEEIYEIAVRYCPLNKRPTEEQQELIEKLLRIESEEADKIGLPPTMRGLLAAAACHEASYKQRVGCGDGGASCGIVQLSATKKRFRQLRKMGAKGKDPRGDLDVAPRYYLQLVKRMETIVRRDCPGRGDFATRTEYLWASMVKTATWRYKCRKKGGCIKWNKDGTCKRHACVSQKARCARRRWARWGKHRRQEAWHTIRLREWRHQLELQAAHAETRLGDKPISH